MRVRCSHKRRPNTNMLYVEVKVIESHMTEPLVLGRFDRYAYYLVGCLDWWFENVEHVNAVLKECNKLEQKKVDKVKVIENDTLIVITLNGAQASNLSDDSVTNQPEGRFSYQEVKTIFLKYKEFLEMPVSIDSTLEFEL